MLPEIGIQQQATTDRNSKKEVDCEEGEESLQSSSPSRPTSMVFKKENRVIPAHLVAEAISTLKGLDLRWSAPITPAEMQYVEQYVLAKYPEYCNGLCLPDRSDHESSTSDMITRIQLSPSRLVDTLTKKTSFQGNFMSIPEIQARNRALDSCGLTAEDYLVVFTATVREALTMVGDSYPFFRGNYYMTVLPEDEDVIREVAASKDAKVVGAPAAWLDLRIKGSQLSQYFRRKCKCSPKGLFAYPAACSNGEGGFLRSSMHWISEAHRNSWHVLLDAAGLEAGKECLSLALHRPDFVTCTVDVAHAHPSKVTCLLVRRKSFETDAPSA
ncbi:uncharacterized protein LOC121793583 isoform X1 [Salvia splendens]|nr:uncharacterized protein LOC121793583 isoform X1 [Salvia splendens]XP_042047549.1 uncharacterized protein LOC121793583 isoform X1 [Salvia splendens]